MAASSLLLGVTGAGDALEDPEPEINLEGMEGLSLGPEPARNPGGRDESNPLKKIYYAFEDKWYDFLDWVNNFVPVYKLIDPIDRVFPSFILFLLLLLLLLAGGAYTVWALNPQTGASTGSPPPWPFNPPAPDGTGGGPLWPVMKGVLDLLGLKTPAGAETGTKFLVQDEDQAPVPGAQVAVAYGEQADSYTTDNFGEFTLKAFQPKIYLDIQAAGFERLSRDWEVKANEVNTVTLKRSTVSLAENRALEILDETGAKFTTTAVASFTCSGSFNNPPSQTTTSGEVSVTYLGDCGTLSATVRAQGYEDTSVVMRGQRTVAVMKKKTVQQTNGKLNVHVKDADGQPVPGLDLRLYDASDVWRNTGKADASGSYSFSVVPGTYYVLTQDNSGVYKGGKSGTTQVDAGAEETVEITVEKNATTPDGNPDVRQVSLQLVDAGSRAPVQGVNVDLYLGGVQLVSSALTNSEGIVVFSNADKDKAYSIVATHPSYVMKIMGGIKSFPVTATPQIIELDRATTDNSGEVDVKVTELGGGNVKDAEVLLYSKDLTVPVARGASADDGSAAFTGLPAGTYYAVASKGTTQGQSSEGQLEAGKQLALDVQLVLKEGGIQVKVLDSQGNAVQGAKVEFYNSADNQKVAEALSDVTGLTAETKLKIDVTPYIVVSKAGFYSKRVSPLDLTAGVTKTVQVTLSREEEVKELSIRLQDVLTEDLKSSARVLAKNTAYWLRFSLVVPDDNQKGVNAVVRTGLDSQADATTSLMVVRDVKAATAKVVKSFGFNATDNYADQTVTVEDAKMARIDFGDLAKGEYEIMAKVFVKNTRDNAAAVEIRFGAKATVNGTAAEKPSAGKLYVRSYQLGELIACNPTDANCKNFAYAFSLRDTSGKQFKDSVPVLPGTSVQLLQGLTYALDYQIFNAQKQGKSLTGNTLSFTNADNALDITPPALQLTSFDAGTSISGTVNLAPKSEAAATNLLVSLNSSEPDSQIGLTFGIPGKNQFQATVHPQKLPEGLPTNVVVEVMDAATKAPVKDALVKLASKPDFTDTYASASTDATGTASAPSNSLAAGQKLYVRIEKEFYAPTTATVDVQPTATTFARDSTLDCLSVSPASLSIQRTFGAEFTVTATKCEKNVQLFVSETSAGAPIKLVNKSSNNAAVALASAPNASLPPNGAVSFGVQTEGSTYQGDYLINVRAKFEGEQEFRNLGRVKVNVNTGNKGESCFGLNKATFDLFHKNDDAVITNRCFTEVNDPFVPRLNLSSLKAYLQSASITSLGKVEFYWTVTLIHPDGTKEILVPSTYAAISPQENRRVELADIEEQLNSPELLQVGPDIPDTPDTPPAETSDDLQIEVTNTSGGVVNTELQGTQVIAEYIGTDNQKDPQIELKVLNGGLRGLEPSLLTVSDYVQASDLKPFTDLAFKYTVTARGDGTDLAKIFTGTIQADAQNHDLGKFNVQELGHLSGVTYYVSNDHEWVHTFFAGTLTNQTTNPNDHIIARSAVDVLKTKNVNVALVYDPSLARTLKTNICKYRDAIANKFRQAGFTVTAKIYAMGLKSGWVDKCDSTQQVLTWHETSGLKYNRRYDQMWQAWGPAVQDYLTRFMPPAADSFNYVFVISDTDPTGVGRGPFLPKIDGLPADYAPTEITVHSDIAGGWRKNEEPMVADDTAKLAKQKNTRLYFFYPAKLRERYTKYYGDRKQSDVIELMRLAADQTGGEANSIKTIKDFDVQLTETVGVIQKTLNPTASETFHVLLTAGNADTCYGPNDIEGLKGESAFPHALFSWNAASIQANSCSRSSGKFVFCDATQFALSLVKRLLTVQQLYADRKYDDVENLLHDEVYLMSDGYNPALLQDVDKYLRTQAFFETPTGYTQWLNQYFTTPGLLTFSSDKHALTPLPSPGLYKMDLLLNFQQGKLGQFMESDQPIASVTVKLNEVAGIPTSNLFERLPLDGQVGEAGRSGYGVSYSGDKVPIRVDEGVETRTITGTNNLASVVVSNKNDFDTLNNTGRGFVFQAKDNLNGTVNWTFSPSYAAPVLLKIEENNNKAEAFYRIADAAGVVVNPGAFGSLWTGVASSLFQCTDFAGNKLFYKKPDAANRGCAASLSGTNYGFSWSPTAANPQLDEGSVYLRTIFYTPLAVYSIKNACASGSPLIVTSAQSSNNFNEFIGLKHNVEATTLNDMLELVRQGKMCLRADNNEVKIWWNEDELYQELEANYNAHFATLQEDNPDFQACSPEGATQ